MVGESRVLFPLHPDLDCSTLSDLAKHILLVLLLWRATPDSKLIVNAEHDPF